MRLVRRPMSRSERSTLPRLIESNTKPATKCADRCLSPHVERNRDSSRNRCYQRPTKFRALRLVVQHQPHDSQATQARGYSRQHLRQCKPEPAPIARRDSRMRVPRQMGTSRSLRPRLDTSLRHAEKYVDASRSETTTPLAAGSHHQECRSKRRKPHVADCAADQPNSSRFR